MRGRHCLSLVLWAGCAHAPPPPAPPPEPPPITVAVIELGDHGLEAESGCVMAILEAGYRAVERSRIDAVLKGDDVDYQALGHALGADLIIDGGLAHGAQPRKLPPPRIVSTRSGDVLAISKSHARIDRSSQVAQKICADLLNQLP